jgi:DNA-binding response OmpR family regulator
MNSKLLEDLKILIVEDESTLARLLKDAIGEFFYNVTLAKDGEDGLKKFKSVKPDLIITDIMMPKMDGLEMTIKIKALNEQIPIIVLSAFSDKEKLLKAIDVGITKYFIKPFDPDEVIEFLNDLAVKLHKRKSIKLHNGFIFDNQSISLYKGKKLINLTKREREFFFLLIKNQNTVVKTELIKTTLWSKEEISDERLRTFIKRLRLKTSKELIENASGQGYLISTDNI